MLWGENRGKWKRPTAARSQTQDTSGLSYQCSATELRQPDNHQLTLKILYTYCTGGTECLSCTPGSHSACAVRTPLGVDWKVLFIRKEPCWVVFLTLNAQSILLHAGKKCHFNKPFAIWVSGEWTYYMHGQLILWTDWLRIQNTLQQSPFLQVVRNAYSSASWMPDYLLVIGMGEGYAWLKRWLLHCVLDS